MKKLMFGLMMSSFMLNAGGENETGGGSIEGEIKQEGEELDEDASYEDEYDDFDEEDEDDDLEEE